MMEACELVVSEAVPVEHVFLNEEKIVPKLTGTHEMSWYLDTRASNHMTGKSDKFAELDHSIKGRVRFGDGSAVDICGQGSILMQSHIGEHRVLSNVSYIPAEGQYYQSRATG
jgi:hypothetical protein